MVDVFGATRTVPLFLFLLLSTISISSAFISPHTHHQTCTSPDATFAQKISPTLQQPSWDDEKMTTIIAIENAQEGELLIDNINGVDIKIWYHTWGNRDGIPVLFVHGGPGQCVADYGNINSAFFNKEKYFVVEVDQRGTGKSEPSVRNITETGIPGKEDDNIANNAGVQNMQIYLGISIQQMSRDYEQIREHLGIAQWLVFGGSWGSTLGLDYAQRFPKSCLGLIIRGIFLSIEEEMGEVYSLQAIQALADKQNNQRYVQEFNTFFDVANREYKKLLQNAHPDKSHVLASILGKSTAQKGVDFRPSLDPNDAYAILKLYEHLIMEGSREAIWKFYVFENNLMEEDDSELLDLDKIDESLYAEAQTVSFFEARLFLKGVYESSREEFDLLGSVSSLSTVETDKNHHHVPVWVVQGTGDAVCPDKFARMLVTELEKAGVLQTAYFVEAGHKATSTGIRDKLIEAVHEFHNAYITKVTRS